MRVALDLHGRRDEPFSTVHAVVTATQAVELLVRVELGVDLLQVLLERGLDLPALRGVARARWAASGVSITIPSGWPRLAPVTTQASTAVWITSRSSIGAGATYLPLLVLNRSFTRPVILSAPVSSEHPLVAGLEPAVFGEGLARQLGP